MVEAGAQCATVSKNGSSGSLNQDPVLPLTVVNVGQPLLC